MQRADSVQVMYGSGYVVSADVECSAVQCSAARAAAQERVTVSEMNSPVQATGSVPIDLDGKLRSSCDFSLTLGVGG
jgi:hypothetical protein